MWFIVIPIHGNPNIMAMYVNPNINGLMTILLYGCIISIIHLLTMADIRAISTMWIFFQILLFTQRVSSWDIIAIELSVSNNHGDS